MGSTFPVESISSPTFTLCIHIFLDISLDSLEKSSQNSLSTAIPIYHSVPGGGSN